MHGAAIARGDAIEAVKYPKTDARFKLAWLFLAFVFLCMGTLTLNQELEESDEPAREQQPQIPRRA